MAAFEDVRRIALGLPGTEEVVTWGSDLTFRVRGKIFAITGEGADRVSVKATPAGQAELIELDPGTYSVAAYVGRFGWVVVVLERIDAARLESLLRDAWRLTAPKRLVAAYAGKPGPRSGSPAGPRTDTTRRTADRPERE